MKYVPDTNNLKKPYCLKHSKNYILACEDCTAKLPGVIPLLDSKIPLLPRAFDTHTEATEWIEEWLTAESLACVHRIRNEFGSMSLVTMLREDTSKQYVLCGFRELYWRELKVESVEEAKL